MQVSLVGQWVNEAKSKLASRAIEICEYHGGNRPRNIKLLARQDIVVTTYETLVSDLQVRISCPLRHTESVAILQQSTCAPAVCSLVLMPERVASC